MRIDRRMHKRSGVAPHSVEPSNDAASLFLSSSRGRSTLYELYISYPQPRGSNVWMWNTPGSKPHFSETLTKRIITVRRAVPVYIPRG